MQTIKSKELPLTTEEMALGVVRAEIAHWGRTTIVKVEGANGFETCGTYAVGPRNDIPELRSTMARKNALRRFSDRVEMRDIRRKLKTSG